MLYLATLSLSLAIGGNRPAVVTRSAPMTMAAPNAAPVYDGQYAAELRGKTAQYKRMKAELSELRAEWGVVSRTESILRNQAGEAAKAAGGVW